MIARLQAAPLLAAKLNDLTEQEWRLIAPLLPPAKLLRRPRETDLREAGTKTLTAGDFRP